MLKLILPKGFVDLNQYPDDPLFFIIGPVRGGDDHQHELTLKLYERIGSCIIVLPNRYEDTDPNHPLLQYKLPSVPGVFPHQTLFEGFYIERAAKARSEGRRGGALLMNLVCESATHPRDKADGVYARDTYGEVGRYIRSKHYEPEMDILVAADPAFDGLKQIKLNAFRDVGDAVPFFDTTDELVEAAARLCS